MSVKRHRWVTSEPDIPFELSVIYEDERIIVVDKPHFLPTTPRGMWYKSTALMRLRMRFGEAQITPAHRLDRSTAGVLIFVREPSARGAYQMLFQNKRVDKIYECLAPACPTFVPQYGTATKLNPPAPFPVRRCSRIEKQRGRIQAFELPGTTNATTTVCLDHFGGLYRPSKAYGCNNNRLYRPYQLYPKTGKTHQLRVHMASLGLPILGDDLYPIVRQQPSDNFSQPLQLVARNLSFKDPYTGQRMVFTSRIPLTC